MDHATTERLIAETLDESTVTGFGCFVTNQSGLRLMREGTSNSLGVLERTIKEISADSETEDSKSHKGGAFYVLGAYWVISTRHNELRRAIEFSETLPSRALAELIASASAYFRKMPDGSFNLGVAPQTQMIEYIKASIGHSDPEVQVAAKRAFGFLSPGSEVL